MRRAPLVIGYVFAALVYGAPGPRAAPSDPEADRAAGWPARERGYGVNFKEAKRDAVKHLTRHLVAMLHDHDPPLVAWLPTQDYVRQQLLQGDGMPGPDVELDQVGSTKTWIYDIKPLDWSELTMLDHDARRSSRRANRLNAAGQLFGGIGVLVVVIMVASRRARR